MKAKVHKQSIAEERALDYEKSKETERPIVIKAVLPSLVDANLAVEKLRVRTQIRQSHLLLQNRQDEETDNLLEQLRTLESYIDGRIAKHIEKHLAYPWFSKVKGIGKENIAKVVGLIDIEKATTISSLWKFAGFAPGFDKRVKGVKSPYNAELRMLCWRLASSLLRAQGKYYQFYLEAKENYIKRFESEGRVVVAAAKLPKQNGKKMEGDHYISEGHIHNMALRKMTKMFLSHLWLVWREAEGLPIRQPYVLEHGGHSTFVEPTEMCDR